MTRFGSNRRAGRRGRAGARRRPDGAGTTPAPEPSARISASSAVVSTAPARRAPCWWRASCPRKASPARSSTSTIAAVVASSWRRSLSSRDSIWWVSSATSAKPNVAAPPLTECAQRKIEFSVSSSTLATSIASRCCSAVPGSRPPPRRRPGRTVSGRCRHRAWRRRESFRSWGKGSRQRTTWRMTSTSLAGSKA